MTAQQPHARAFDLPGWPCPPRVRDIPHHQESWGWVFVSAGSKPVIAQDEMGYLWADGTAIPRFQLPPKSDNNPGAILCWTECGLGVWVHPKSLRSIGDINISTLLDSEPDRWVPIAVALHELPAFIKASA
jgi:hypothetical protein